MCTADRREHATNAELDLENSRREISWLGRGRQMSDRRGEGEVPGGGQTFLGGCSVMTAGPWLWNMWLASRP